MATKKPRFSITLDEDLFNRVNEYQHEKRYATQTKAIVDLIQRGAESLGLSLNEPEKKSIATTKKSPDVTEVAPEDEAISLEESNKLLVALGYITEGEDLSDADLAFLTHVIGLLDAWFDQRHQGSVDQSGMPA